MILYHFTGFNNLVADPSDPSGERLTIWPEGLKPNPPLNCDYRMPPLDVVWFTSESDPKYMFAHDDELNIEWKKTMARITVVIPSTDKRLMRWETWVRKQRSSPITANAACGHFR